MSNRYNDLNGSFLNTNGAKFTVSPGEIIRCSYAVLQKIEDIESEIKELDLAEGDMDKYWKGKARDKHADLYKDVMDDLKSYLMHAKLLSTNLKEMGQNYNVMETQAKTTSSGLNGNVLK